MYNIRGYVLHRILRLPADPRSNDSRHTVRLTRIYFYPPFSDTFSTTSKMFRHSSFFNIHSSFFKYSDPLRGYKNLIILYYNIYFLGSEYFYKKINLFSSIFKENLHMYYDINKVTPHEKIAEELFLSGYNCAQSVFAAFSDLTGISKEDSARIASSFGGGMCGLRSTCGAVSGMLMALGTVRGYSDPADQKGKKEQYAVGKALADEFSSLLGSVVCRELLAGMKLSSVPSVRTEEYYKSRPCAKFCAVAAHLLDSYLESTDDSNEK